MPSSLIVERHSTIRALVRALRTKRFLILAGLSGTGKTQLARRLAQTVTTLDRQLGNGRGLLLVEQALDDAVRGETSTLFEALPGYPDWVGVKDVGLGQGEDKAPPPHRKQVGFLPVRPDWTDAKKVFGHYNPLTGRFYPTDALVVMLNAWRSFLEFGEDAAAHFLVLDEMNLARVEYYLSDVLSLMESGASLDPMRPGRIRVGELARVHPLDSMLVSTGTRGLHDERSQAEAQQAFSNVDTGGRRVLAAARTGALEQQVPLWELDARKFLYEPLVKGHEFVDRPNDDLPPLDEQRDTLCLLYPIPPRVAYPPNLVLIGTINVDETTHAFAPKVLDRAFVLEFTEVNYAAALSEHPAWSAGQAFLEALHQALAPSGHHFGYRVASEMLDYTVQAGGVMSPEVADFLLLSKVLPKLRGTEHELARPLERLQHVTTAWQLERSRAKVAWMQERLAEAGFASFF